jgi:hypothetical protein
MSNFTLSALNGTEEEDLDYLECPQVRLCINIQIWGQFHQRSTCNFYVRKLHMQLLCACVLGLYFTGAVLLAQKLRVEC